MSKFKVYLSPSDQTKNAYAYGGTTEAIQCGKIAEATKKALERNGIDVMLGQYDTMANRCAASDKFGANLHVPIHTNAANGQVGGTRMFCYNSTGEGYKACKAIFNRLAPVTPGTSENIKVDDELFEVRVPAAPTAYIEVDFHDNPEIAKWIINHTNDIAEAICHGICDYFGQTYIAEKPKQPAYTLPIVRKGDKGVVVLIVQKLLGMTGDGIFGAITEEKLKAFQKKCGSKICDGIVGTWTWSKLLGK